MKFQKKEGTQKVEFFGTSNFGSDMRLSPRIRWNLKRKKVLKKSTCWGPPILVLTWGCHLESDEISKKEGAQKVGFLELQNTGPLRRGPKEILILRVLIAYKNTSPCLGPYKMTFVRLYPCPQLATLPDTRNLTKMRMLKRFCFLLNFLL